MLGETSLVFTVGSGETPSSDSRMLRMFRYDHPGEVKEVTRLCFPTPIIALKVNAERVVVALEHEVHVFSAALAFQFKIPTLPSHRGLLDLTSVTENAKTKQHLIYAQTVMNATTGASHDLTIVNSWDNSSSRKVEGAHVHAITNVAFSKDGKLIATASEQGTLIKVIPTSDHVKEKYSFRRGKKPAEIYSIAFNKEGELLAVSSSNSSVHIFRVKDGLEKPPQTQQTYLNSWWSSASNMMYGNETRGFAKISLPQDPKALAKMRSIVAFSDDSTKVYTITQDGMFLTWDISPPSGAMMSSYWNFVPGSDVIQAKKVKEVRLHDNLVFKDD